MAETFVENRKGKNSITDSAKKTANSKKKTFPATADKACQINRCCNLK